MRVVYVSSLPKGGPVAHLRTLAPAVARAGAEVRVVCLDEDVAESFRVRGVEVAVAPLRHKTDLAGARGVRRLFDGADVVHTQDRRAGLLGRPLARLAGARAVHTYHGLPEELGVRLGRETVPATAPGSRLRLAWLLHGYMRIEFALARLGAVVVPSQALARFLVDRGMPPSRLHVIPHGIDVVETPVPRPHDGHAGPTIVGAASNLEHEKGVDVLIEACALTQEPIRLELLGDGLCRPALEHLARERGLDVRFAGHVGDVSSRLAGFDVFALPSRAENLPVAVLEAMAAGLPVVATRVGGVPELVVERETGLLVEPDDPAALARSLDFLAADPAERLRLGSGGAHRARDQFGSDRMATRTLALYDSLA